VVATSRSLQGCFVEMGHCSPSSVILFALKKRTWLFFYWYVRR
jgi:hypothetical protein